MDPATLALVDWAYTHGAPGVLLLVCLWLVKDRNRERDRADQFQAARISDLQKNGDVQAASNEKMFKAADELARATDLARRDR